MYSITFVPALLFLGPLTGNFNKKLTVGLTCIAWGVCTVLHAYAENRFHLYILFALIGLFQSVGTPIVYVLITDYFEPRLRVKAFFVFSILSQLGDPIRFMTSQLITLFGWKQAWVICGLFGIIPGALCVFTI
jgi:MFS family permease